MRFKGFMYITWTKVLRSSAKSGFATRSRCMDDAQRFQDKSEVVKLWERLEAYIRLKKPAYVAKNWKDPRRKNQENRKK